MLIGSSLGNHICEFMTIFQPAGAGVKGYGSIGGPLICVN